MAQIGMQTYITNRKATFNYELLEKFEAGILLLGTEVKSIRKGQGKVEGAHVVVRDHIPYLVGAEIPAYQPKNAPSDYDPARTRRLLLSRKQIDELAGKREQKGLTVIATGIYPKGKYIKVGIAIARGKKKYDKRESIKKRDTEREIGRKLKGN